MNQAITRVWQRFSGVLVGLLGVSLGAAFVHGVRTGRVDLAALAGTIGRTARENPRVLVGAVTNSAGLGGDEVVTAARRGIDEALAATPLAARARGRATGHVLDATLVRFERAPGRLRAEASVVVSTHPGRRYEFASSSAVTLTGASAEGERALADGATRAMRSAVAHALSQVGTR